MPPFLSAKMMPKISCRRPKTEAIREIKDSPYGTKHIIKGMLSTPKGTSAIVETVWIIESGKRQPRFVTAYPAQ